MSAKLEMEVVYEKGSPPSMVAWRNSYIKVTYKSTFNKE